MSTTFTGIVQTYNEKSGYGYIRPKPGESLNTSELLLVHRKSLRDPFTRLKPGDCVQFQTAMVPTGTLATDVSLVEVQSESVVASPAKDHVRAKANVVAGLDYLSKAVLARDQKRYDEAEKLFRQGLDEKPTIQLVLGLGSMVRNLNRRKDALAVYQRGLNLFPQNINIIIASASVALSLRDYSMAVDLYRQAVEKARLPRQRRDLLINLARAYYESGSLREAHREYSKARKEGRTELPAEELKRMNIAAVRSQHPRGNATASFFENCGFQIARAELSANATESGDFFVQQVKHSELIESYGLAGSLLVRCYFKAVVSLKDIQDLDDLISECSQADLIDEQVAFIVLSSLPEDLQRILAGRIEQKNRPQPAIIPLTQSDVDAPGIRSLDTLRAILDRWLYRRDLYATNSPVSGSKFFGRDQPLAKLRDAISTSTCSGVYGLRKVGKTSLLQECRRRSTEAGNIVVYVDLLRLPADVTDCRWLYWRIANAIRQESQLFAQQFSVIQNFKWRLGGVYKDFQDVPPDLPVATAFDSDISRFIDVLPSLPTIRPKVVLLLDEIERLLPTALGKPDFVGFFDLFSYLRGLNQERPDFLVIVTGANASLTETAQFDGRDNPVFNYFKEIYLPHLEPKECSRMITTLGKGMGLEFTDNALSKIYSLTGGHPFFARQFCSYLSEIFRERPFRVTEADASSVTSSYLELRSSHFAEIVERLRRDYPEELAVCEELARAGGVLPLRLVRKARTGETIKHLTGYQIVEAREGKLAISMDLLTMWLKNKSQHA
jgi:tetratricopeptide (TPR) repeat protein/cold shock CspA family protein